MGTNSHPKKLKKLLSDVLVFNRLDITAFNRLASAGNDDCISSIKW